MIVILLLKSFNPIVEISIPSIFIVPDVGSMILKNDIESVDFPQPLYIYIF